MVDYVDQWTFPSKSNPDKNYKVSLKESGEYICHCWPYLRTRKDCSHIETVKRGDINPDGKPIERFICLAAVPQVMYGEDGAVMTPLIPIGDTWFQATLLYDLLNAGISWGTLRERYDLAKANTKKNIIAYVEERGRKVYASYKDGTYMILSTDEEIPQWVK